MSNRLENETSPYLLQHKDNPVDWYPWCKEAFERAKKEDKPVFLSIGYSACHWCHVLAHESFEDEETAELLNKYFISIKVDKEERPDIDSVYMAVCQAFTGSGGWPTSIFMTADKKPFFAGTYFPKTSRTGMIGFRELLTVIHEKWISDRDTLTKQSEEIIKHLNTSKTVGEVTDIDLPRLAVRQYERIYDEKHGGFGNAPKFPTPHNLLFLLDYYEKYKTSSCLYMAENTLTAMYKGGMFDHIGFGFCRYSTDRKFLVPHFEKMLYDNALLILAYCKAYTVTKKKLYLEIAEKTASYILKHMTSNEGVFFSSQDADSEGEEGKYYLFTPNEVIGILGEENGTRFNRHFDITHAGNFEGQNIPNLLKSDLEDKTFESFLPVLDNYRQKRTSLHKDEKILTFWNSLMISAMCQLYIINKKEIYLSSAKAADIFIRKHLCRDSTLYVSYHMEKRGEKGFLDDYAGYIFAKLHLYRATFEPEHLEYAKKLCDKVISDFKADAGGFYLYGNEHEELILRPKETYDGAVPSGNSLMLYNLVTLHLLTDKKKYKDESEEQLDFLSQSALKAPINHAMFLKALLKYREPIKITAVIGKNTDTSELPFLLPSDAAITVLPEETSEYVRKNGNTTYYVCVKNTCLPPTDDLSELLRHC